MKTGMKQILSALVFLSALTGCKIEDPDFFVPEVAFAAAEKEVVFEPAGGTESFSVEANCDWSVSCPAEWVTLSVEAGDRNGTVEIAVKPTKLPRNTTITLYSNEVESRTSVIAVVQKGVVEISSVSAPVASNVVSASGTTATLESSYVAVSLGSGDVVTAGFTLTPKDGSPFEVAAVVDAGSSSFKAEAAGLVANTDYTCVAWACLNGGARVEGLPTTFRPTVSEPVTIVADFSSNALWGLPESNSAMEQKEVSVTDNDGYTWKIFGGCINGGCLWLACQSKSKFCGYVILPQLDGLTVKSISFPNDGPSPSGKARITISVSEDGGSSFTPLPGCTQVACGTFQLSDQKPGSIYKVENVDAGGTNGFSKTVKLTIQAE